MLIDYLDFFTEWMILCWLLLWFLVSTLLWIKSFSNFRRIHIQFLMKQIMGKFCKLWTAASWSKISQLRVDFINGSRNKNLFADSRLRGEWCIQYFNTTIISCLIMSIYCVSLWRDKRIMLSKYFDKIKSIRLFLSCESEITIPIKWNELKSENK